MFTLPYFIFVFVVVHLPECINLSHSGKDGKIAEDLPRTEKNWRAQPLTFL